MAWFYEIRSSDDAVLKRDGGFADPDAAKIAARAEAEKIKMSRRIGGPTVAAQRRMSQSGNLTLIVQPQIQLQEHGTDVVLKIRLAEGVNVKLWGSNSCGYPNEESKTFTASGTYTVSLQSLSAQGSTYTCAVSSDGLLKASMLLQN
jgi:hypothetical protein